MRKLIIKWVFTLGLILFGLVQPVVAFDFSSWDGLLKKYVESKTINGVMLNAVEYTKLAKDSTFPTLVKNLETVSLTTLKTKDEKLAFWINVYNIMAIKMVLDNYPVKSIKDAGNLFTAVWKKPVGQVAGKERTLNEIEHEILRKMGEPRIHVAIVCASVSCPDLRKEAYTAEKLDNQLDDQMKQFLANTKKGLRVDEKNGRIYLSSIFKWFGEDFESQGGVRKFIAPYSPQSLQASVRNTNLGVSYLNYDWGLNEL